MSHESPQDLDSVNWSTFFRVWLTCLCAKFHWPINISRKIQEFGHPDDKREAIRSILNIGHPDLIEHPKQDPIQANKKLTKIFLRSSIEVRRKVLEELEIKLPLGKLVAVAGLTMLFTAILVVSVYIGCANGRCVNEILNTTAKNSTSEENLNGEMQTTIIPRETGNNNSTQAPDIGKYTVERTTNRTSGINENDSGLPARPINSDGVAVTSYIPRRPRPIHIPSYVCRKPGSSMFKFLNLPIPSGADECEIIRTDLLNPDDMRQSTRVYKHHCSHGSCYFSTATIFVNLFDTSVLSANSDLKVLKLHPRPNCEALQTGTLIKPTEFSGLLMLQIELKTPEECRDLYLYVSLMEMPRLSSLLLNNIIVSKTSWEPLRKILEKPTVKNFSFNNSIFDYCSFDGIDAGKFTTAVFLLRNGHEMNVTRVVKQFIDQASNLTELRWNSPIPVRELRRTLQKMPKLKVAELTVELEQVGGKAQFNLSLTEHRNLENLHINLVVKHQGMHDDAGVEISLRQFERTGQKLSRIYLHATHAANILKPVLSGECWNFEVDDNDTTVKCTKQVKRLGA